MSDLPVFAPLMMTIQEFADLHGIDPKTVYRCVDGISESYPPLRAKRARKPGSKKSRLYITAEAAAEWRAALPDA